MFNVSFINASKLTVIYLSTVISLYYQNTISLIFVPFSHSNMFLNIFNKIKFFLLARLIFEFSLYYAWKKGLVRIHTL